MWRLWSKKNMRLAVATNGVALRDANGKVHQIACPEHLDLTQDVKALNTLLESQRAFLAAQKVEVVLAHSFVRFLVLPWQQVMRAQDWQAIARHAFKKTFGNAAADWQLDVRLSGYQKPVVAAAIDQATFAGLNNLAQSYDFQIAHIKPLANFCVPTSTSNQGWLMIAEPQRLLLIQHVSGIWQNSWVDAPPRGAEQQHAEQLVQRILVQQPSQQRPARVTTYVSAELQPDWQKNSSSILQLANKIHQQTPHSVWMGRL